MSSLRFCYCLYDCSTDRAFVSCSFFKQLQCLCNCSRSHCFFILIFFNFLLHQASTMRTKNTVISDVNLTWLDFYANNSWCDQVNKETPAITSHEHTHTASFIKTCIEIETMGTGGRQCRPFVAISRRDKLQRSRLPGDFRQDFPCHGPASSDTLRLARVAPRPRHARKLIGTSEK